MALPRHLLHPDGFFPSVILEPFTGGLAGEGEVAILRFMEAGGRVVVIDEATEWVADLPGLGVENVVADLPPETGLPPRTAPITGAPAAAPLSTPPGAPWRG